jgi:diguanylate cyclase (GGDEF)-like protein
LNPHPRQRAIAVQAPAVPPSGGTTRALVALGTVLALAATLILAVLVLGGRMGDRATMYRLERYLDAGTDLLAQEVRRHSYSTLLAARMGTADGNPAAMVAGMAQLHGMSFAVLLDAQGRLRQDLSPVPWPDAQALADRVRPHLPTSYEPALVTLIPWEGRPHIVVRLALPERGESVVAIRPVDAEFFTRLIAAFTRSPLRFGRPDEAGPQEVAQPIRLAGGPVAGHLLFEPELAGRRIVMGTALPLAGAAVAIMLGLGLWLLVRLGGAARSAAMREAHARFLAMHDELTGLANRRAFQTDLASLIAQSPSRRIAVALLDLDHFKRINDSMGHQAGDAMIRIAAARLRARLPAGALVARLGGDEFAVALALDAEGLAPLEAARAACGEPYSIDGQLAHVTASLGLAIAPTHGRDVGELLRMADIALYQAKADGRAWMASFDSAADERLRQRNLMEAELRRAIAGGELLLHYQPLVDARTEAMIGVEALVRWNHPERGLIPPGLFLPLAEDCGLIVPLGTWVLRQAMQDSLRLPGLKVAVNVSPVQLRDHGLVEFARASLAETGAEARHLELEVTESIFLQDDAALEQRLATLRAMGFSVALDDFGTGFSSLGYLRRFAFDRLKIDQSFVRSIEAGGEGRAIVTAVAQLGQALGLAVTAEGVETSGAADLLREMGCTHLQGYRYGKPMPIEALLAHHAAAELELAAA